MTTEPTVEANAPSPPVNVHDDRAVAKFIANNVASEQAGKQPTAPSTPEAEPGPDTDRAPEHPTPEPAAPEPSAEPSEAERAKRDYETRMAQLSAKEREFKEHAALEQKQIEEARQNYLRAAQQAAKIAQQGQDPIVAEWMHLGAEGRARLAQTDPSTYIAKKAQYEERVAELQYMQHQYAAEQQAQTQKVLQTEIERIKEKVPEWKDAAVAKKESAAISKYLKQSGFNESEIDSVTDHRALVLARKAYLYDQMIAEQKALEAKKVQAQPARTTRPGIGIGNAAPTGKNKALLDQAKKSGNERDIVKAVLANL